MNKFTFFVDTKAFIHEYLVMQNPTVIIDNEAERRFEEILKEYPKYGKNYKTLRPVWGQACLLTFGEQTAGCSHCSIYNPQLRARSNSTFTAVLRMKRKLSDVRSR